jgi:hypothetical protein
VSFVGCVASCAVFFLRGCDILCDTCILCVAVQLGLNNNNNYIFNGVPVYSQM